MLCAAVLGICSAQAPIAGVFASAALGALYALNAPLQTRALAAVLVAGLALGPAQGGSLASWLLLAQAAATALAPRRWASRMLHLPRWTWQILAMVAAASICAMLLGYGAVPTVLALLTGFYLGVNITRHLAMTEARLRFWGDEDLVAVTRDLLLGRVTSGMLHDLAQPLNVIAMANGNMGYVAENLAIPEEERQQLLERVERIANHTQNAAAILGLFRWFGRDGSDDPVQLTVRSALERAVAATRSNVRHHDVAVTLQGNGLDYLLPGRHGSLEMIAVAALLCAFASFVAPDGTKKRGKVLLHAALSPAHVVVSVQCTDAEGHAMPGQAMDVATAWLVEQVAHQASGDFRPLLRDTTPERFVIRLGRDDI
jgi:signal transduction histidine kinase